MNTDNGRLISVNGAMTEAFGRHEGRRGQGTPNTIITKPNRQGRVFCYVVCSLHPMQPQSPLVDLMYFMRSQAWDAVCQIRQPLPMPAIHANEVDALNHRANLE